MKQKGFIITGLQPWDTPIGSNCKNIAVELSASYKVIYIDYAPDIMTVLKSGLGNIIKACINLLFGKNKVVQVSDNLYVGKPACILISLSRINSTGLFNYFNRINNLLFARSIKRIIKKLESESTSYIHFNDNDIYRGLFLKELLPIESSSYYSRDNLVAVKHWQPHGIRLEPQIIKNSDFVFANSAYLAEQALRYNKKSFYIGQGCETEMFDGNKEFDVPQDMLNINGPIIGYVGVLYSLRLNLEWLNYLAKNRPQYNIVLVGPEDEVFANNEIHQKSNVYFLGAKKPEELPAYMNAFDVCINPQILNQVTVGNYPRKIDEYLCMGKPVVALKTKAMEPFKEYVSLSENEEEFAKDIDEELHSNNEEKRQRRMSFASGHTWKESVSQFLRHIGE